MRNGIYRVWYKTFDIQGVAAIMMADGRFVGCDRTHNFLGTYTDRYGRFGAELEVSRNTLRADRPEFPDCDVFHMTVSGASTAETVIARITFREQAGKTLDVEFVWCSEI